MLLAERVLCRLRSLQRPLPGACLASRIVNAMAHSRLNRYRIPQARKKRFFLILLLGGDVIQFPPQVKKNQRDMKVRRDSFPSSTTETAAILCPDASASESQIKEILSFFGAVKVGQPWFMTQPVPLSHESVVEILCPPEHLKPSGDFKALLVEHRGWIRTSRDKGFDAFLAFKEQASQGEESSWEIRRELRRREDLLYEERRRNALKWNLLLHLSHEVQKEEKETEDMLKALKGKDSPLKEVVEEEGLPGPLSDLPEGGEGPIRLSGASMAQVLEAWFSLFQERLIGDEVLLALSPAVFQYLCDTWEEWGEGSAEEAVLGGVVLLRRFPLLGRVTANAIVRHLSGKTIGLIQERKAYGK